MTTAYWLCTTSFLAATSLQAPIGPGQRPSPFMLPPPTGRHAVGTTAWRVTDKSRSETLADAGLPREVEVLAWYPATRGSGLRAPYLRWGLFELRPFAPRGATATPFDSLADVRTHAVIDATPIASTSKFPTVVFSHGYGGMPSAHTALFEDLASHGYAILSIVHPYESAAARLADGRLVSFLNEAGAPRESFRNVLDEWSREDETMAAVTRAVGDDEQRRLLGEYLSGLRATGETLRRWVDDTKLVLDRLAELPAGTAPARLASRLDTARVGVAGHSMGGVTAGQFCLEDSRCAAGLNLDGIPQYGSMISQAISRPFLMVYSARAGRLGASDAIYRRSAFPYFRVDIRETLHLDFTDMIFWNGPLRARGALGTLAPLRVTEITRAIVREYFGQELVKTRSALLAGKAVFPEVTVHLPTQTGPAGQPSVKPRP